MKIAVIGECMVELSKNESYFYQTFGGDTLNCAIYMQRTNPISNIQYITVLGDDIFSKKMYRFFKKEGLGCDYIDFLRDKNAGLYIIDTINGERSFTYYRNFSAAKKLFSTQILQKCQKDLQHFDMIYFSAITLAIMEKNGRKNLLKLLKKARKNGTKIAYDSNYRKILYKDVKEAKALHVKALKLCDIFLPSLEDEKELWGESISFSDVINKAEKFGVKEIVVKNGKDSIFYTKNQKIKNQKSEHVNDVVDTTAAGDSFNGVYLGSRCKGLSKKESIKIAKNIAAKVIAYKGAIIPKEKM